jgi:beta-ribofuranosylaminobenzene 5'-phosphate synthase
MHVITGSRLHFGLLHVPGRSQNDRAESDPLRAFGGAGLMIERPALHISAQPGANWSAEGPNAELVLRHAAACAQGMKQEAGCSPLHFRVLETMPRHSGLGSGTQIALAIAKLVVAAAGRSDCDLTELARLTGRGRRSSIGIHGFSLGGFLVDGGKLGSEPIAALQERLSFPESWPIVIALPPRDSPMHGGLEATAFGELARADGEARQSNQLSRLLQFGIIPALRVRDYALFSEALHDYNRLAGARFSKVQNGCYADARTEATVHLLRRIGIAAVGQSSWGPAVYAICPDEPTAKICFSELRSKLESDGTQIIRTRTFNRGAILTLD